MTSQNQPRTLRKIFISYWLLLILLFVGIFIVGCTSSQGTITQTNPPMTVIPTIIGSATISLPTASAVTNTPVATSTIIMTSTKSPLPSSPPIATATSVPTLTFAEGEMLIQELMATNEECQLPCWWGIHIGDPLENVGQKFNDFGMRGWNTRTSNLGDGSLMGSITTGYYDEAEHLLYLGVSINFHVNNDNVDYMRIAVSRPSSERGEPEFARDWQNYFLTSILQDYGKPTQVYLRLRSISDPTPAPIYSLSLLYLEQGISITYNLEGVWLDNNQLRAEFCSDMENTNPLEISLFNPQHFEEWSAYFPPYDDELFAQSTWEARTDMDLDTFYQTFQDLGDRECIEVTN